MAIGEQGEDEGADELAVGEPEGLLGVERLDGEDVDEDRLAATEEHVEGGCVLEDPAVG